MSGVILASLDRGYLDTFHCMLKILKRDFVTGRMRFVLFFALKHYLEMRMARRKAN
jgi:hypothetical protein